MLLAMALVFQEDPILREQHLAMGLGRLEMIEAAAYRAGGPGAADHELYMDARSQLKWYLEQARLDRAVEAVLRTQPDAEHRANNVIQRKKDLKAANVEMERCRSVLQGVREERAEIDKVQAKLAAEARSEEARLIRTARVDSAVLLATVQARSTSD